MRMEYHAQDRTRYRNERRRRVHIGIDGSEHRRCRTAGRKARYVHALAIDGVELRNLVRDAGDDRGFTAPATLIANIKPIPTFLWVRSRALFGIGDQTRCLIGENVHVRATREVVGRLRAAMQHDDERTHLTMVAERNVERIPARSRSICERVTRRRSNRTCIGKTDAELRSRGCEQVTIVWELHRQTSSRCLMARLQTSYRVGPRHGT